MRSLGIAEQMPFTATLTNPVPKGQIETSGTFGPWQKGQPGATPLAGNYSFQKADLGTIKGIGGILDSTGAFQGELQRIAVKGETQTPDFHLDISRQPVALSTTFEAVVDGTDGDTYLNVVNAKFLQTAITAKGAVTGTKGVKGRTVKLNVHIDDGRIEDLLRLAVKGDPPLMVGRVGLQTDFELPPGEKDVVAKLLLAGKFGVGSAKFTDAGVQKKLSGMSHRARGRDSERQAENVVSDLSGTFRLKDGSLSFSDLAFGLPGATVRLHGSYGLRSEAIMFDGTLRMDATISEAAGAGGMKGFFLKAIDPLFRKKGAGALVPIKVRGTREKPEFGLDVGKSLQEIGWRDGGNSQTVRGREDRRGVAEDPDAGAVSGTAPSRHGTSRVVRASQGASSWCVFVRGLRAEAVRRRSQVRERHRLAELLRADRRRGWLVGRRQHVHASNRGPLQSLRRPSRARVRGRPAANRLALLHQRSCAEF